MQGVATIPRIEIVITRDVIRVKGKNRERKKRLLKYKAEVNPKPRGSINSVLVRSIVTINIIKT